MQKHMQLSILRRVRQTTGAAALLVFAVALFMAMAPTTLTGVAFAADDDKSADKKEATSTSSNVGTPQAHSADKTLQVGTIVQLAGDKGSDKVKAATSKEPGSMYGVVVDERKLSITITNADQKNTTFVAATGTYPVLVSSQNGAIKVGDYVTVSAVDGIGMFAKPEQKIVFGRAVSGFDGKSNVVGNVSLKTTDGKDAEKAAIGMISVVIDIRKNPNEKSTKADLPSFLQRTGEAIAEKPISPLRIFLSIGITVVSVIAAIVVLYSGIHSSLISIGRNPLSRKSIFRGLFEVVLTSFIILIIGLFAVYLLLKL